MTVAHQGRKRVASGIAWLCGAACAACAVALAAVGCEQAKDPATPQPDISADADSWASDATEMDAPDVVAADASPADSPEVAQGLQSVCKPGQRLFLFDTKQYSSVCAGNTVCKQMPCQPCATFCSECDGPHCSSVTVDDSCMPLQVQVTGWGAEPLLALPLATTQVQLSVNSWGGYPQLELTAAPPLPAQLQWQEPGGPLQSAVLATPVKVVGDFALFHGHRKLVNGCTGATYESTIGPNVVAAKLAAGILVAGIWLEPSGSKDLKAAWLRVYEDAAGTRAVQWIQPDAKVLKQADVRQAFPLVAATPLQIDGKPFAWADKLGPP